MNGMSNRDCAFLAEMGITPLWSARAAAEPAAAPAPAVAMGAAAPAPAPAAGPRPGEPAAPAERVFSMPSPAPAPGSMIDSAWGDSAPAPAATDEEIAQMDWRALNAAIAACSRCGCQGERKPVFGNGARAAVWMVAAGATTAADEKERQPLAGDPGKLLANMLAAVGLSRDENVYVTNLVKCRLVSAGGGDRAPTPDEAVACRPFVERELALCGAGTVLTMGQVAANGLLGKPLQEPLAGSRGSVHRFGGVALVATLHPGELLRRGADKALAWADLCLAKSADAGPL
ncbi:MAG: Uracil-DNA glycosylase [Massilia sp.]|nr:Uracil-DNA glycosylase [Massilia sp.]